MSLVLVIVLSYLYLPLGQDIQNRGYSDTQRIAYWQTAIKAFEERPVFGYGYRNFEPNVVDIKQRHGIGWENLPGHAHNNFMEHLGSTGGLGLIAFTLFCLFWLWEMFRRKDLMGEISFVFIISFLISGML